jgi:glyoxylase-like metal-dependent hydrolase (beta-lactamase superfamily II)
MHVSGCHGADHLVAVPEDSVECRTCGSLLNDTVLLDAGTGGSRLYLHEQRRIQAVLLTHLHFDHIRDLPTLADNLTGEIDEPIPALLAKELHKRGRPEVPVYI